MASPDPYVKVAIQELCVLGSFERGRFYLTYGPVSLIRGDAHDRLFCALDIRCQYKAKHFLRVSGIQKNTSFLSVCAEFFEPILGELQVF